MNISIVKKLLVFVLLFIVSNVNALPTKLINDVSIKKGKNTDIITVKFSVPMHYTHHFPKTKSRTVIINLRAFSNDAKIVLTSSDKEKYRIPRKKSRLVSYLRVESLDNNVGKIAIQFKKKLNFSVKQIDKRTLQITLGKKSSVSGKVAKSKKKTPVVKTSSAKNKTKKSKRKTNVGGGSSTIIYVLNLESYEKGKKPRKIPKLDIFKKYKLFRTRVKKNNVLITRLRLGFFRSKTEAGRVKRKIKVYYPNAFVTLRQKNESALARKWFAQKKITPTKEVKVVVVKKPVKKLTKKEVSKVDKLFAKGKLALVEQKYRNAISYFTKVSEIGAGETKQQSLEYIGLAREKNGQIAHAKAEYKKYLKLYPDGIGHERVKQRLEGLLTAQLAPKKSLVNTNKKEKEEEKWELFSTISQNYRNQITKLEGSDTSETDNSISSYFNTAGRKRGGKYDLRYQIDIDHRYDFTPNAREKSSFGISTLYFDYISLTGGGIVRLGRQTRSSGGVLGRFDGVWYGYPLSNDVKLNLVAGLPVRSGSINFNSKQQVLGLSVDFERVYRTLNISPFIVQQIVDGVSDRRAIGTEMRYNGKTSSYFGILDYDIEFNELNTAQFVGNWLFSRNRSVNFVVDHRAAPIYTTSNALIGQGVSKIQDLLDILSEDEVRALAVARTTSYDSLSISGNLPLSARFSLSADLNVSKTGATETTTSPVLVNGNEAVGPDYYFGVTFIGSNLFSKRDTNIMSLRQSTGTNKSSSIDLRSQFNMSKRWRMRPRIRYDVRKRTTTGTKSQSILPSARFDFRYTTRLQFQFELGYDYISTTENGITTSSSDYAIDLSYIFDF